MFNGWDVCIDDAKDYYDFLQISYSTAIKMDDMQAIFDLGLLIFENEIPDYV